MIIKGILCLAMWGAICPCAGEDRIPVLDKVPGHKVTFDYTCFLQDGSEISSGTAALQDSAYAVKEKGLEIRCDGTVRWTVNTASREVVIEEVEEDAPLQNPAFYITHYQEYSFQWKVHSASERSLDVTVKLNDSESVRLVLRNIVFHEKGSLSDFVFEAADFDSSYVVTDLR